MKPVEEEPEQPAQPAAPAVDRGEVDVATQTKIESSNRNRWPDQQQPQSGEGAALERSLAPRKTLLGRRETMANVNSAAVEEPLRPVHVDGPGTPSDTTPLGLFDQAILVTGAEPSRSLVAPSVQDPSVTADSRHILPFSGLTQV